jgi:hypothetical protein
MLYIGGQKIIAIFKKDMVDKTSLLDRFNQSK